MQAKKGLIVLTTAALSFGTLLAGCSSDKNTASSPTPAASTAAQTNAPKTDEPLNFSFYVNYDWYAPKGYGTSPATKWLIENKKVTVEEISSGGNAKQKFGTMIASNQFPDVIQMDRGTDFDQLVKNGKIVSYDKALESGLMPNLKKQMKPETLNLLRAADGKLYGIPNWFNNDKLNTAAQTTNWGFIVNGKVYNELGKPSLETWDDIYEFAKKVKEKYPDMIPVDFAHVSKGVIMGQIMLYAMSGETANQGWAKTDDYFARPDFKDNTFKSIFEDPGYKESLALVNRLFREKLLSQDMFTQKLEQFKEKLNNGKIALAGIAEANKHGSDANKAIAGEENDYIAIKWPVKKGVDRSKTYAIGTGNMGWNYNAVTINAKNPDAIFKHIDYLFSEEYTRIFKWGRPGVFWDDFNKETNVPNLGDKWYKATDDAKKNEKLGDWNLAGSSIMGSLLDTAWKKSDPNYKPEWGTAAMETNWSDKVMGKLDFDQFNGHKSYPANSEEDQASKQILTIMEKAISKMVFAKDDAEFNKEFDAAKAEVEKAGYKKILDYKTKVWQENLKKMSGK